MVMHLLQNYETKKLNIAHETVESMRNFSHFQICSKNLLTFLIRLYHVKQTYIKVIVMTVKVLLVMRDYLILSR